MLVLFKKYRSSLALIVFFCAAFFPSSAWSVGKDLLDPFKKQTLLSRSSPTEVDAVSHVHASLIAQDTTVKAGRPFWVALRLEAEPGWHTYYKEPGDIGEPTTIDWALPEGFEASPIHWPKPQQFTEGGFVSYGYEGTVHLLVEINPPEELPLGSMVTLRATVHWVACADELCVPGRSEIFLDIPVCTSSPEMDMRWAHDFQQARTLISLLPKWTSQFPSEVQKKALVRPPLKLEEEPEVEEEAVIVEKEELPQAAPTKPQVITPIATVTLPHEEKEEVEPQEEEPQQYDGFLDDVVRLEGAAKKKALEVEEELVENEVDEVESSFRFALLMAFLGGMLLNVMPCVLPVVSLKVLSMVKLAGEKRSKIFLHGIVFAAGMLLSYWALAAILLVLRKSGHHLGWGFQLQDPTFVAILSSVLVVFACSLFGVFEMGASTSTIGAPSRWSDAELWMSLVNGVVATLVATPCTGPLLGAALGLAITLEPFDSFLLFTSIGFGMAFPYILFALFPFLLHFVPKPGRWMVTFKQLMGFFLLATVMWLLWVFSAETSKSAVITLVFAFLLMSFGVWVYGRWSDVDHRPGVRWASKVIALGFLILGILLSVQAAKQRYEGESQPHEQGRITYDETPTHLRLWHPFSSTALEQLLIERKPVFIDFTAKWCLLCQTNKLFLYDEEVTDKMVQLGVVKMQADWTKEDPLITQELARYGRSGVPLYVLYGPDQEEPMILPQVLSEKILFEALDHMVKRPHPFAQVSEQQ